MGSKLNLEVFMNGIKMSEPDYTISNNTIYFKNFMVRWLMEKDPLIKFFNKLIDNLDCRGRHLFV